MSRKGQPPRGRRWPPERPTSRRWWRAAILLVGLGGVGATALLAALSCNGITGASDIGIGAMASTGPEAGGGAAGAGGNSSTSSSSAGGSGAEGAADASDAATGGSGTVVDAGPEDAAPDALDPLDDEDADGVPNEADDCPLVFDPCQYDRDNDGVGDECDPSCEEHCTVRTCDWEGQQGCNCGTCPPPEYPDGSYRCVFDSHYEDGLAGEVLLPDGGSYQCESRWYKVCVETCSPSEPCSRGSCLELSPGSCICFSFAMLPMCGYDAG